MSAKQKRINFLRVQIVYQRRWVEQCEANGIEVDREHLKTLETELSSALGRKPRQSRRRKRRG